MIKKADTFLMNYNLMMKVERHIEIFTEKSDLLKREMRQNKKKKSQKSQSSIFSFYSNRFSGLSLLINGGKTLNTPLPGYSEVSISTLRFSLITYLFTL